MLTVHAEAHLPTLLHRRGQPGNPRPHRAPTLPTSAAHEVGPAQLAALDSLGGRNVAAHAEAA